MQLVSDATIPFMTVARGISRFSQVCCYTYGWDRFCLEPSGSDQEDRTFVVILDKNPMGDGCFWFPHVVNCILLVTPGLRRVCVWAQQPATFCVQVSVLEMDGQFDKLEELIYIESHLSNTSAKFYGEITQQMLKNSHFPGSNNGTGLFQTICGLKLREVYEALVQQEVRPVV